MITEENNYLELENFVEKIESMRLEGLDNNNNNYWRYNLGREPYQGTSFKTVTEY